MSYAHLTSMLRNELHYQPTESCTLVYCSAGGTAGGNAFNASDYNTTDILALLQSGLAYVSVWTAQSGNSSELRGQIMPYGKVVGASPTISK